MKKFVAEIQMMKETKIIKITQEDFFVDVFTQVSKDKKPDSMKFVRRNKYNIKKMDHFLSMVIE
jgi:hypothetical protein